ncbi:hypothetical protein N7468_006419 [Penicillium chermesinum]|uniref:X-Pro dipeptidyl-peptidase n=1 Tax=Penicillium chermesinum TaxID=63820 RepID=A0A9W9NSB4_9EURO|nr:uncharacterized protein N7468_006419 [Penicillium chermesinum]KAJ5225194.1 hypothetical protein N7468_006419 [Penicillium chermesinum]
MVSSSTPRGIALRYSHGDDIRERIERVKEDLKEIKRFYPITISPRRAKRLYDFFDQELSALGDQPFDVYNQQEKIDYLLLKNYLERQRRELDLDCKQNEQATPLLPFAHIVVDLCEAQALGSPMEPKAAAQTLFELYVEANNLIDQITANPVQFQIGKNSAFRAANAVQSLRGHLRDWFKFYKGYDPLFDWWVESPYNSADISLERLAAFVRETLVGIEPGNENAIVGQPIGREGLLDELLAEMIPYSPEEILRIGEKEFHWCIAEMEKASRGMGHEDWHQALEEVKNDFVEPGKQIDLVRGLVQEAITFVEDHQLVTVPQIAKETWQMFMMSPERQKVNPFFLGGTSIIVSYPVGSMAHDEKLMSMRGNNIHFSRATVFHEMIPGHHLQFHYNARHKPYRKLFDTPFWIEGWSLYWEFLLWNDDRFKKTPQNRIGMLFWRLHRCARIIFSVKFHLGQMSPQECIDLLVAEVGHERATAEGEVRRSLNGDYSPLYQAGYMLGALQIFTLRQELVETGAIPEKDFHDRFLQGNRMPIELVRASMIHQPLSRDYKPSWRFYDLS